MNGAARWAFAFPAMLASAAGAQSTKSPTTEAKHAAIAGVVSDSLGRPISGAMVFVDVGGISAASDDSGHFVLHGLTPGKNGFTITRIGFAPVSFETSLLPDSMVVLSIRMRSVQALDPVRVTAVRVNAYLAQTGFTERKRLGLGSYLSPEHVDSLAPGVTTPAELLRGLRGIDVRCQRSDCVVHARQPPDCFWLFVDGVPLGTDQIDVAGLTPSGIAAIEVYERASIVPLEFQRALPRKRGGVSLSAGCGAIAVWTKARVP
jgi:Carboxypeptidase regulatory-like domain